MTDLHSDGETQRQFDLLACSRLQRGTGREMQVARQHTRAVETLSDLPQRGVLRRDASGFLMIRLVRIACVIIDFTVVVVCVS